MIYNARYWTNHFKAGLTMAGRNEEGKQEWIGNDNQWSSLAILEDDEMVLEALRLTQHND